MSVFVATSITSHFEQIFCIVAILSEFDYDPYCESNDLPSLIKAFIGLTCLEVTEIIFSAKVKNLTIDLSCKFVIPYVFKRYK